MIGFSVPPFFSGVLVIVIFSVNWAGSLDLRHHAPVTIGRASRCSSADDHAGDGAGAADHRADLSRFMRASMLDNLNQDYVRTARAKG
jgi:peptide/nickel transport system permease protein